MSRLENGIDGGETILFCWRGALWIRMNLMNRVKILKRDGSVNGAIIKVKHKVAQENGEPAGS